MKKKDLEFKIDSQWEMIRDLKVLYAKDLINRISQSCANLKDLPISQEDLKKLRDGFSGLLLSHASTDDCGIFVKMLVTEDNK